ncbi:MAG: PH domain-containing protein [Rikenellaceae bacterium]
MESSRYGFHLDRVAVYWTIMHIIAFVIVGLFIYAFYVGGFFSAWFISFVVALIILMVLSVPRYVEVDDRQLSIVCVLDRTDIKIDRIISIKKVSPRKIRWVLPVFGGCGFLGYYGHFFDFRHFTKVVIYATEWRYLVEITDAYEDLYYISCRDRDRLVAEIKEKQIALMRGGL